MNLGHLLEGISKLARGTTPLEKATYTEASLNSYFNGFRVIVHEDSEPPHTIRFSTDGLNLEHVDPENRRQVQIRVRFNGYWTVDANGKPSAVLRFLFGSGGLTLSDCDRAFGGGFHEIMLQGMTPQFEGSPPPAKNPMGNKQYQKFTETQNESELIALGLGPDGRVSEIDLHQTTK